MPTVTTADGSTLDFSVEGSGPALLLLSGQGTDRRWWDRVAPLLARDHKVVRADYLGTGNSEAADGAEYSTRRFAQDAVAVMDAARADRFHVYGTSMGGKVAQWVALDHPERIDRLVLGCTSPGGTAAVLMDRRTAERFGRPGPEGLEDRLGLMYSPGWLARNRPNAAVVAAPTSQRAAIGHRKASAGHDTSALVGRIAAPTLVLQGTDDEMVPPENAGILAALLPDAEVRMFDGARHAYFEEHLDEATDAVLEFLATHSGAAP